MCSSALRCSLPAYVTGEPPNPDGGCSPAGHVRYEKRNGDRVARLGAFTLNVFSEGEAAGYPTLCKGRFVTHGRASYLFEEPTSLNVLALGPTVQSRGEPARKREGRKGGRADVGRVVAAFRRAVDAAARGDTVPAGELDAMTEGQRHTAGAYRKSWH